MLPLSVLLHLHSDLDWRGFLVKKKSSVYLEYN